jgi:DUF1680 family protein
MRLGVLLALAAVPVLAGDFSSRFDLTLARINSGGPPVFRDDFILADAVPQATRRFTDFSGDVSGRYIGAMSSAAAYSGRPIPQLDRIVHAAIQLQKPDGHFGGPMSEGKVTTGDMAILWGNGRLLIGLLEYYDLAKKPEALDSARKLGDFLIAQAPRFNSEEVRKEYNGEKFATGYICWTQNIEGLVALFRITQDQRYCTLAKELAARTDRHPSQHSHGFLTSLRGIVDLYRVTGEARYLEQVRREWKGVADSGNLLVQGAVPEMFAPAIKRDEGCSEADWLRLTLNLWEITHDPEYLQAAQVTLFNEFAFNQFHTGDFGHHTFSANGISAPTARAWWCCTFHGLRALADVFRDAFRKDGETIWYDLPVDARFATGGFAIRAESSLERDGSVTLRVVKSDGKPRQIAIQKPEWATGVTPATVTRAWKTGETLRVVYGMRTRIIRRPKQEQMAAVCYGPWLLAVDEAASPHYFDEPAKENRVDLTTIHPAARTAVFAKFTIPVAHFRFQYLPGGYPMQPGEALLRPLAEFTASPDSNQVDFWLPAATMPNK